MDLVVTTQAQDAGDGLRPFHSRLLDADPCVRRNADVTLAGHGPAPGGAPDGVRIVLDGGFRPADLAAAWPAWRAARPSAPEMTFGQDGVAVALSGQDIDTATRALEALRATDRRDRTARCRGPRR